MLKQAVYWLIVTSSVFDGLLLGRLLGLRLYRIYAFIALDCVLGLMLDGVGLYVGLESPENTRVWIYTRFLYALLTPLIVWDVFEESKQLIGKLRRLEAIRLFMALTVIGLAGCLLIFLGFADNSTGAADAWPATLGIYLWGGSSLASTLFLWKVYRALRALGVTMPHNTFVWSIFYLLSLSATILYCAVEFSGVKLDDQSLSILNIVLIVFGLACTVWCALRLRAAPVEESTAARG